MKLIGPTRQLVVFALCTACYARGADQQTSVSIEFLSGEQARLAIVDESQEPYVQLLGTLEMTAKTGHPILGRTVEEQRQDARRRYRSAVMEFTDGEKETLRFYVEQLDERLREVYPRFARVGWKFIKVGSELEGGLPHTRGRCIVLSPAALRLLKTFKDTLPGEAAVAQGAEILVHEQTHVVERMEPGMFRSLFVDVWGFEKAAVKLAEEVNRRVVVNPDGVDLDWVYPIHDGEKVRYITPRIVFAEGAEKPRMPGDFRMIAVEVRKTAEGFESVVDGKGKAVWRPLEREKGYLTAGIRISSIYHPNEIAADVFAALFVKDFVEKSPREGEAPDLAAARRWFAEHLGK